MTFPTAGFAVTESTVGQRLMVPLIWMLPVFGGRWQSIAIDTDVVTAAVTLKEAEAPEQVVWPSVEVPVRASEYPMPAATPPINALNVDELAVSIDPTRLLGPART